MKKTLCNSTVSEAHKNVPDLNIFGDGDAFKLICKASSESEGWMKSTKAMYIPNIGCVIQVTTQQGDNVAEALTFVPGVKIVEIDGESNPQSTPVCLARFRVLYAYPIYSAACLALNSSSSMSTPINKIIK